MDSDVAKEIIKLEKLNHRLRQGCQRKSSEEKKSFLLNYQLNSINEAIGTLKFDLDKSEARKEWLIDRAKQLDTMIEVNRGVEQTSDIKIFFKDY